MSDSSRPDRGDGRTLPFDPKTDLAQLVRGVLMGAADTVPGVSGGTVALVLGIYTRLVTAVSRADGHLFSLLRRGRFKEVWTYLDGRFLFWLLVGVGGGALTLAGITHAAMEEQYTLTFALFSGLIAGSVLLVARLVGETGELMSGWTPLRTALLIASAWAAYELVSLEALENPPIGPAYLFFCGAIAICAMILPGVSGAFLLLVLGAYHHVSGWSGRLKSFDVDGPMLLEGICFGAGLVVGLALFSKLLRWLLTRHGPATLATLTGAMLGSLRQLWPFVGPRPDDVPFKEWRPVHLVPPLDDPQTWLALLVAAAGLGAVLLLDWFGRKRAEEPGEPTLADGVIPPASRPLQEDG
ncbi:DUF368 domain-containing protein [Alienimonas chondri]|uniref:DUF368 domain-containing protein n=1 Tax=Alienimonas chondri TaxID=2681879 RepID=A0ABX1VIH0_9PLAN|nr:DUF368 domain-containing protein [Alienimonas chondri]NNJ27645.1 hypothetical protein [Alienimonas chondri]